MKYFLIKYKWIAIAVCAIALFSTGFFIGRANQKAVTKTVTEYVKGETITKEVKVPEPYDSIVYVMKEVKHYLPSKPDTIRLAGDKIYISEKIDTAKIVDQFAIERKYRQILFDNDTTGKLVVNTSVQFNEQKSIGYSFTPIHRVTTITKQKKNTVTPFISASYNTLNYGGIGGGVFIKNIGLEYKYLSDFKGQKGHEGGLKIKF